MSERIDGGPAAGAGSGARALTDEQERMVAFARRFDLRRIIGLVLGVYGVICLVLGLVHGDQDRAHAAGLSVNLWTGVGLLIASGLLFAWDRMAPVTADDIVGADDDEGPGAG